MAIGLQNIFHTFAFTLITKQILMNKILLLLSVLTILTSNQIFAQCNPTPFAGSELTYPSVIMGISVAAETQYYEQTIVLRVPNDTVYLGAVIAIDSAGINSITGLPASLTWDSDSDNDFWPGNSFGCLVFKGVPVVGDAGVHKVEINISINALGASMPYILEYDLEVLDAVFAGVEEANNLSFNVLQNQPNPFDNYTQINYVMPNAADVSFIVYDILGNKVAMKNYSSIKGENTIKFYKDNLAKGVYVYELNYDESVVRKRMIIQ